MPYDVSRQNQWLRINDYPTPEYNLSKTVDDRFPYDPEFYAMNSNGAEYVVYFWGTRTPKPIRPDDQYARLANITVQLDEAYRYAQASPDPSTQNGAVLLADDLSVSCVGYTQPTENHYVGVDTLNNREEKYKHLVHAERSCIYNAVRNKVNLEGQILVCPWYACPDCAWAIIECGVGFVWGHYDMGTAGQKDKSSDRIQWSDGIQKSYEMFRSAGVGFGHYIGNLDWNYRADQTQYRKLGGSIRVSGEEFTP